MRTARWIMICTIVATGASASAAGSGLGPVADTPRWQARVSTTDDALRSWAASNWNEPGLKRRGFAIHGDYYFSRATGIDHTTGGFRATGTMFLGSGDTAPWSRGTLYALTPSTGLSTGLSATPYAGVGYTAADVRSGFSFSADLGLLAPGYAPGALRVGANGPSLDDPMRGVRLAPLLQVGVSYSF